jgi:hypothetical protein
MVVGGVSIEEPSGKLTLTIGQWNGREIFVNIIREADGGIIPASKTGGNEGDKSKASRGGFLARVIRLRARRRWAAVLIARVIGERSPRPRLL